MPKKSSSKRKSQNADPSSDEHAPLNSSSSSIKSANSQLWTSVQKSCFYVTIFFFGFLFALIVIHLAPSSLRTKKTEQQQQQQQGIIDHNDKTAPGTNQQEPIVVLRPPPPHHRPLETRPPSSLPNFPSIVPSAPPPPTSPTDQLLTTKNSWLSLFDPETFWTPLEDWMLVDPIWNRSTSGLNPKEPQLLVDKKVGNSPSKIPAEDVCLNYNFNDNDKTTTSSSIGLPCDLHPKYYKSAIDSVYNGGEIRLLINGSYDTNLYPNGKGEELTEKLMNTLSMLNFYRIYRNVSLQFIGNPATDSPILCISAILHTGNCRPSVESLTDCVHRLGGPRNIEQIVPAICKKSRFWGWFSHLPQFLPGKAVQTDTQVGWMKLKRGVIPTSTVATSQDERQPYVKAEDRTPAPFTQPVFCSKTHVVMHPIGYGVPKNTVVDKVSRTKTFDFMPLMPSKFAHGFIHKFGIEDEGLMREWYSSSYFAWSNRRGGFEVLRHLEILASGAIPFMPDIEMFPKNSLTHYPKQLLAEVLSMPGVNHIPKQTAHPSTIPKNHEWYENNGDNFHFKKRGTINTAKFNRTLYFEYADKLLDWTKKYLTCGAVVAGMLKRMGKENVNHVLISALTIDLYQIWQPSSDSYMVNTILQGFDELGINVTILARDQVLWRYRYNDKTIATMSETERGSILKNQKPYTEGLYGQGMCYKGRSYNKLYDEKLTKEDRTALTKRVLSREFDLVVFDFIENEMRSHAPLIESVSLAYNRSEVAIIDLFDHHVVKWYEYPKLCDMATIFVRELDEKIVCIVDYNRAKPKVKCPIPSDEEQKNMFVIDQPRGWD